VVQAEQIAQLRAEVAIYPLPLSTASTSSTPSSCSPKAIPGYPRFRDLTSYPTATTTDHPDRQRDPTPIHQPKHRTRPPTHPSAGLVTMATTPSTPCPRLPLPPPTSSTHVITIYGWSTRHARIRSVDPGSVNEPSRGSFLIRTSDRPKDNWCRRRQAMHVICNYSSGCGRLLRLVGHPYREGELCQGTLKRSLNGSKDVGHR
jgi:hypothetical protein